MPKVTPLQVSFAAGELSPRMAGRTDSRGYHEGLRKLNNFIPLAQGPTQRRPGTVIRQTYPGQSKAKLIPFQVANDEFYIIILINNKMYIFNEVGSVVTPNLLLNPRFQTGASSWTAFDTSNPQPGIVTFAIGSVTLNPSAVKQASIRQTVSSLTIGQTYTLTFYGAATNFRVRAGTTLGGAEYGEAFSGIAPNSATVTFVAIGATVYCECAAVAGSAVPTATIVASALNQVGAPPVEFDTPYNDDSISFVQYEMVPAGRTLYITHPLYPPQELVLSGARAFSFSPVAFTSQPADWTTNNYPAALTFYQGRLWFGGTINQPSKFWGSKSGLYTDFTAGTLADDSVVYTISKRGAIRWMQGLKTLLIGTDNSEFVITSEAGVITPTDIVIEPQSSYGSDSIQPIQLGNQVLYVSPDGRKLRAMGYRFEEQGWVTADLSFASEHITLGRIVEVAYAQNPESIVWMTKRDGSVLTCSYDRGNNIIGWADHDSPEIVWVTSCTARLFGTDTLWLAGRVDLPSGPEMVLAVLLNPNTLGPYMDLAKTVISPTPVFTFGGFEYLEGKRVAVLGDGAVQPSVVVTNGQITVETAAYEVTAGLPFLSKAEVMPIEAGQNPNGTEPMMKRLNRIFVRLFASRFPIINGTRPPTRFPQTPMNTAGQPITTQIFVTNTGWDREEVITVEEELPVALTILGLYGEMALEMPQE